MTHEMEDRRGAEGEDCAARKRRGGRFGAAPSGSSEPDLRLEEATPGSGSAGIRERHRRGCGRPRARDRAADAKVGQLIMERDF